MFVVPYSRIKYAPIRAFSIPLNMSTLMYLFDTYRIQFYWCKRECRVLSTMKLLGRCFTMKNKDTSFITTTLRGKDLVSGKTIVSGTLATMRGFFGILFKVMKVSVKRRSWRVRIRSGSSGILLVLDALLNLWLHGIRTHGSGMWRISSVNTTIRWWNKVLLVFYVHIQESEMSRKLIFWRCRFLGSADTR